MSLLERQHPDGHWEGEVVWNTMLLSQYLITHRLLESEVDAEAARVHYGRTVLPDGSWPFHPDGEDGSLYVTTLAYVALRLVGTPADELGRTREWLRAANVATVPTWGRMWLALLGLYPYEGINPIPPEFALLPVVERMYCHTRHVYLGLAYLYGVRFRAGLGELGDELRAELYPEEVDFAAYRHVIHESDLCQRPARVLRLGYDLLVRYERRPSRRVRAAALRRCVELVERELTASGGQCLSPVNGLLACLVLAHEGRPRDEVLARLATLDVWRWQDEENGLRIAGARSAIWDTSFATRALLARKAPRAALESAHRWLLDAQVVEELPPSLREGRDTVAGGWCFYTGQTIRWPVSDSTAEALSALLLTDEAIGTVTPPWRAALAAEFIMARQNPDGGFGTYERTRAPGWVEKLNPSEMYSGCMTDLSHVECTASCVSALVRYRRRWPDARVGEAIRRGVAFLRAAQRPDGSYRGAWGINFTYAAFFVVEALTEAGVPADDPGLMRLAEWLVARQREDGGWGEHHASCRTGEYTPHPVGQATMTAWALLALVPVVGAEHPSVVRGARFLDVCDPASDVASGVFFGTAVLDYRLYREIFPIWAANVVKGFVVWV